MEFSRVASPKSKLLGAIKAEESGTPTAEFWWGYSLGPASFYKLKIKYGCLNVSDTDRLKLLDDENPSCRAVDWRDEVAPRRLVGHLGKILHVDVDIAWLMRLEAALLGPRRLDLQVTQVADAMSAKAAVEPRARDVRVQEFPHHRQQVIERHQQRAAQRHSHSLLSGRQCGLKPIRRTAAILDGLALAPFPYSLFSRHVAFRKNPRRFIAGLYRHPDLRHSPCLAVKLD